MNLATKTRLGLVLSLGVLAGLGLIVLPGIVAMPLHHTPSGSSNSTSPPSPRTASGNSNSTTNFSGSVQSLGVNSTSTQTRTNATTVAQSVGDSRITLSGVSWLFVFLVVPAVGISLLMFFEVSWWARRARARVMNIDQSNS